MEPMEPPLDPRLQPRNADRSVTLTYRSTRADSGVWPQHWPLWDCNFFVGHLKFYWQDLGV